jgi:hypothetical protein
MDLTKNRVAQALKNPYVIQSYSLQEWDLLIRQARQAALLVRIYRLLQEHDLCDRVPDRVMNHFVAADTYAKKLNPSLDWEFRSIAKALAKLNIPVVFLKGAAYRLASNRAELGRLFSDIDILVPFRELSSVENALKKHAWVGTHQNEYDQRYYREWMHELPPMIHLKRQTTLDVHHNILPNTCSTCPDPGRLFSNLVKVDQTSFWILAPEDRVLHSATHLFHESEFKYGLRDISDIDLLLREFTGIDHFWTQLLRRADELNQQIPLFYALRYASKILDTPVPDHIWALLEKNIPWRIKNGMMDFLFIRALMPDHSSCDDRWTGLARWLLFVRSHWLKMPLKLLFPHLIRKSFQRFKHRQVK